MKKIISVLLALILCLCSFAVIAYAAEENIYELAPYAYGYVLPATLTVRDKPGTDGERLGGLSQNAQIFILSKEYSGTEYWYKINFNGKAGYVLADKIFYHGDTPILSFYTGCDTVISPLLNPILVPPDSLTKTGYTFLGWSKTKGGTKVDYRPLDSISLTGSTMLYAVWQAPAFPQVKTQKVHYNSDVWVDIIVDNIPYGCRLLVNDVYSEPQMAGCGTLSMPYHYSKIRNSENIFVAVTNADGDVIDDLSCNLTLEVKNNFWNKFASFFRFIFNGFRREQGSVVFQ